MIHTLLNSPLIIALQATAAKNSGNENAYYMGGSLVTIVVAAVILQFAWFEPAKKKLKNVEPDAPDPNLLNELEYADYLVWAAEKGQEPLFNKMTTDEAITVYNDED